MCPVSCCEAKCVRACRNDVASATAVWHQVKEEVMEIHSKLECRTQLDKQVWPHQYSPCASVCSDEKWPPCK